MGSWWTRRTNKVSFATNLTITNQLEWLLGRPTLVGQGLILYAAVTFFFIFNLLPSNLGPPFKGPSSKLYT